MRRNGLRIVFMALGLGLCFGCGMAVPEMQQPVEEKKEIKREERKIEIKPDKPSDYKLEGPVDVSLADLLTQPRKDLAAQAAELAERIRLQERKHREGEMDYHLLPDFHLPQAIPVFRKANYSSKLQLSLPPYLAEAQKDNDIALHLARHGDGEAALKMARDDTVRQRIAASRYEKNYPVEWTRVVALLLHNAQVRLATGDEESGRLLVSLHQQLLTVLDPKARSGQLGATLLPRGRSALAQAAEAWRKANQPNLADQADALLAKWGKAPAWVAPFLNGSRKEDVARLLDSKGNGHALAARIPARALDLFGLPVPDEGVEAVIGCFNNAGLLAEVLVVYQPSLFTFFPKPENLGQLVEDWDRSARDITAAGSVKRRLYTLGEGGLGIDITTVPDNASLGGLVRIGSTVDLKKSPGLDREVGPVSMDRSFEQNRLRFAPSQKGRKVTADQPEDLKKLAGVLPLLDLQEATLESDSTEAVVTRLTIRFAPGRHGLPPLGKLVLPLWEKGGPARIETVDGKDGYALALVWEDEKTHYTLTLPHSKRLGARLEVVDRGPAEENPRRAEEAVARDRAERRQRIQDKKPLTRIGREREKVRLGMTEAEVVEAFPQGEDFSRRKILGGLSLIVDAVPEKGPSCILRELFVRFGPDKRVAEVKVRYASHPGVKGGVVKLLEGIRAICGAPHAQAGSWATAWADYPKRDPAPVQFRWEDDITILTCQRDSEGIELTLLDRPLDREDGIPLGSFQCVSVGPENCGLGMKKADLLQIWKDSKPTLEDNVLVLTPPEGSPYSQIQAYLKDAEGPLVRIVALHAKKWDNDPGADELEYAVQSAWAKGKTGFGSWRRADVTPKEKLQSLTNHDDVRRVCVFWQETSNGPRVYTEWTLVAKGRK